MQPPPVDVLNRFDSCINLFLLSMVMGVLPVKISAQSAFAVRSIECQGNKTISTNTLLDLISTHRGEIYSETGVQSDVHRVVAEYEHQGFLDASIDSVMMSMDTTKKEIGIVLYIHEGKPSIVHSMSFMGNRVLRGSDLLSSMETKVNNRFIPPVLEADIQSILHAYELRGFPLAKVSVYDIVRKEKIDDVLCDVSLDVDEGQLVHISELRIEGNTKTKNYVIQREARLQPNEIFHPDIPARVKQRLERLQIFSSVSLPELYIIGGTQAGSNTNSGLSVRVVEGNQNTFDAMLGYLPSGTEGSSGYIMGLVSVQLRNLLGTGRKVGVRWFRENESTQEIEFHYTEPWVASYPVDAQFGLFQRRQDSTYVRNQYDISLDYMVTENFTLGASISLGSVYPTVGYGQRVMPESKTTSLGVSVKYDSRDNPITPINGIFYSTDYSTGSKSTSAFGTLDATKNITQRVLLDLSSYLSPVQKQVLAMEFHLRDFTTSSMDVSDLFHLGGATTLRGYREGQFLGSRLVWLNTEYRFIVVQNSYFYGFVDGAYMVQPEINQVGLQRSEQSKIGYGIGIRFETSIGFIGVSIALGEGDTFSTAKLHFRVSNDF